jgi:hypothetical protein
MRSDRNGPLAFVTLAQAGVQGPVEVLPPLDSRFRGNDEKGQNFFVAGKRERDG